jgi:hypothetical protein
MKKCAEENSAKKQESIIIVTKGQPNFKKEVIISNKFCRKYKV